MAVRELSLLTAGSMQRFLRDPRVTCLISSISGSLEGLEFVAMAGGKLTRRSSLMNCVSWEWVLEQ